MQRMSGGILKVGQQAPDVAVTTLDGSRTLSDLVRTGPRSVFAGILRLTILFLFGLLAAFTRFTGLATLLLFLFFLLCFLLI